MLGGALIVAGSVNLILAVAGSLQFMILLKGVNGLATSFGWPALAKIFMAWFTDPAGLFRTLYCYHCDHSWVVPHEG